MDKRILKTKKNLYEGLLKVMKEKEFENIKISEICEKALTTRSTFYDHFTDKYELLYSLIEDLKLELNNFINENNIEVKSIKEYYLVLINLLLEHIEENIDIYGTILKKNNNSIVMDMINDTIYKDIEKELSKYENNSNVPTEIITRFYVSAVSNICIDYIIYPNKYKKEQILDYLNKLIPSNIYKEKN